MGETFRVDLRGLVDLLSRNLYSSPRVVVRELLQNAVDALTAAEHLVALPDGPHVLLVPSDVAPDGRLHCVDAGVGLTPEEAEHFLATIGASSKRDELGLARGDFLGQFGIGLLSAFLVGDEIEVVSRSARGGPPLRWTAGSDGTYRMHVLDPDDDPWQDLRSAAGVDRAPAVDHGTWVRITPRFDATSWTTASTVRDLATRAGRFLPRHVQVVTAPGERADVRDPAVPWQASSAVERTARLEQLLGVRLLDTLQVSVPAAGLTGVLGLLADPAGPVGRPPLQVHAKGMLVGEQVQGLLPSWAFIVRGVVDVAHLRLTAGRESLHDDDGLDEARDALAQQVRAWWLRLSRTRPERFEQLVHTHLGALTAAAAHDDELLEVLLPALPLPTSTGPATLTSLLEEHGEVLHTTTDADFALIGPVAAAQGITVVNGGVMHVGELLARLPRVVTGARVVELHPRDLVDRLDPASPEAERELAGLVRTATTRLRPHEVAVLARGFDPQTVPALVLDDPDGRRAARDREARDGADELWAGLLDLLDTSDAAVQQLVLNTRSPLVRRLAELPAGELLDAAVDQLYCQALVAGRRPVGRAQRALMQRSFTTLVELGLDGLGRDDPRAGEAKHPGRAQ